MSYISHSKPYITTEDEASVFTCLQSGMLTAGTLKKKLESEVASYLNFPYAIASTSGTNALKIILEALRIGKNDEIILPTYVCHSVYDAIIDIGAVPVLCDVSKSWIMTKEEINPCISKNTKAIILVHLFGIDASFDETEYKNIVVIHDYCQAFGMKPLYTTSGPAFCSFNATKCLTTGEGGMALFRDEETYNRAVQNVDKKKFQHRLSDLQCSLGLSQLKRYDLFLQIRKKIAERYMQELKEKYVKESMEIYAKSIFFRFPIKTDIDTGEMINEIEKNSGIAFRKGVDELLHIRYRVLSKNKFCNATELFKTTVSIPIYPTLSELELNRIINVFNEYVK